MALNKMILTQAAQKLLSAAQDLKPIDPLTETYPGITLDEAYQVQLRAVEMKLADGRRVVGKKVGLTSAAMQQMFNVMEPDYGHLFDDMLVYQGAGMAISKLFQPRIEGEIAFILGMDLMGPGVTPSDVLRATACVTAALEIIDSRIRDWKIKIQDTVADNGSSAAVVLGTHFAPVAGIDLKYVGYVMTKNGQLATTAAGAAVLGSPAQSVAWLANKMGPYGIPLKAGEIILSGSAGVAIPVRAGDSIHLTVDRLGDVDCYFY
jgi:2-keto-4-pentenoate hydratase